MIFPLVEFLQAKTHLKITGTQDEPDIQLKILAASAIVMDYLKIYDPDDISPFQSPPDDPRWTTWEADGAPWDVQAATLLVLGELFSKRESSTANVLSPAVTALLHRHRHPAYA